MQNQKMFVYDNGNKFVFSIVKCQQSHKLANNFTT